MLLAINVKTGMPSFGILANHKIKMFRNSMKKIMIQKITQNNWNFWTVNLIMQAKKIVIQSSDFPVRCTGSYRHKKKHWVLHTTWLFGDFRNHIFSMHFVLFYFDFFHHSCILWLVWIWHWLVSDWLVDWSTVIPLSAHHCRMKLQNYMVTVK